MTAKLENSKNESAAYYNEVENYPIRWMRNLITTGHISLGRVDERSIVDLKPDDLRGATQAHFFAGIGGWSYALRLAGWPDDRPVWTGSCPCQPFSGAGRRGGFKDERHLWPTWFNLIRECRPPVIFGEQVASPDGLEWLDLVSADLEGAGYAFGAADLCAASVGAPHIRQRLYFAALASGERLEGERLRLLTGRPLKDCAQAWGRREARVLGNAGRTGGRRNAGTVSGAQTEGEEERRAARRVVNKPEFAGATHGFWADCDWIPCTDGKARPVEPGSFPLASGVPNRVGKLRAYGNAVVPQVAAAFVKVIMEVL